MQENDEDVIDVDNPEDLAKKGLRRVQIEGDEQEYLLDNEGNIYNLQGEFVGTTGDDDEGGEGQDADGEGEGDGDDMTWLWINKKARQGKAGHCNLFAYLSHQFNICSEVGKKESARFKNYYSEYIITNYCYLIQ